MARTARFVLAVATGALAIAACGSSKSPGHTAEVTAGIKYAACMRAHGVSNFPDSVGGGIQIPDSVNPSSPSFQGAQRACQSLMPGGSGPPSATAQQKQTMLDLSRCMRAHGISGFPDPVTAAPANPAGMALAFGRAGAFIVIPDTLDPQSPRFEQAAKTCHLPGA